MALTKVTSALTDLDGGITIDNITIDGTEIDLSSGDLTLDVAGDIILDADGGNILFKDGSVGTFLDIQQDSSDAQIISRVQDKDIVFRGNDNGSTVTSLTLDMSDSGRALFNYGANIPFVASADGTVIATFTNSARVGIGTTSPQDTVDIRGNILQVGGSPEIHIGTTSSSHYNWRIAAQEVVDTGFEIAVGTQSAGSDAASDTYSTKFTLLANGKCGIGETDPLGVLHIKDGDGGSFTPNESANTLVLEEDDNCGLTIFSGNNDNGMIAFGDTDDADAGSILYDHNSSVLSFTVNAAERMRILSGGTVLISTTTNDGVGGLSFTDGSNGVTVTNNTTTGAGNGHEFQVFRRNSTQIGSIVMSNTDGVTYATSSDARLKNVLGEAKGLEIVNKLNPVNFEWKESKKIQDGLIAQEVEELIPHAVAVSEEGHYSMDYSQVVTPLIKAIQEQQKEIEELKQNSHPPKTIEEMEGYEDLINRIKELENK